MTLETDMRQNPYYMICQSAANAQTIMCMMIDKFPSLIPSGKEAEYSEMLEKSGYAEKMPDIGMSLKEMVESPELEFELAFKKAGPAKYDKCPTCQKEMDATWDACPFCQVSLVVPGAAPPPHAAPIPAAPIPAGQAPAATSYVPTMPCKKCGHPCTLEQWQAKVCGSPFCGKDPTKESLTQAMQETVEKGFEAAAVGTTLVGRAGQQYAQSQAAFAGALAPAPSPTPAGQTTAPCPICNGPTTYYPEYSPTSGGYCPTCPGYAKDLI